MRGWSQRRPGAHTPGRLAFEFFLLRYASTVPPGYPPGRAIPSLQRIHQETGLSTKTIRRAIAILAAEGLVHIRPGWGTFVVRRE
jgi:hypothetical protein